MNLKDIKKAINHNKLSEEGWKLSGMHKGFFGKIVTLVLVYKKNRYCDNIDVGYRTRYYNRFGLICVE